MWDVRPDGVSVTFGSEFGGTLQSSFMDEIASLLQSDEVPASCNQDTEAALRRAFLRALTSHIERYAAQLVAQRHQIAMCLLPMLEDFGYRKSYIDAVSAVLEETSTSRAKRRNR